MASLPAEQFFILSRAGELMWSNLATFQDKKDQPDEFLEFLTPVLEWPSAPGEPEEIPSRCRLLYLSLSTTDFDFVAMPDLYHMTCSHFLKCSKRIGCREVNIHTLGFSVT
jgi:hypothetical protein